MSVFDGFERCAMVREDPEIDLDLPIVLLATDPVEAKNMEQLGASHQLP
jgi:CheY-like chemotaxis protein